MTDTRDQGHPGQPPADPSLGAHGANHHEPGDVRSVKVDMGQGPPVRRPPAHAAPGRGVGMLTSAVLALIFGGAGAWAYERFLAHPSPQGRPEASPSAAKGDDPAARKNLAGLEDRMKDLSDQYNHLADQYKQLQARVESEPKAAPAPDLGPIEQRVAQVDRLANEVDAIGKRVDPLNRRLDEYDSRIKELDQKVDALRTADASMRSRSSNGRDRQVTLTRSDRIPPPNGPDEPSPDAANRANPPASAGRTDAQPTPAEATVGAPDPALGNGVNLFNQKQYSEAYAAFRELLQSRPDDARSWYYAALSYGLSTGGWTGMTQTMVEEGVTREKAGKPAKAEIDATFAGLSKETGKDWLAFYRRRAG